MERTGRQKETLAESREGLPPDPIPKRRQLAPVRAARYHWLKLLRIKGDPFVLARGFAVGVFVGITPTIPFHTMLIVLLCTIYRGNILAGIAASWLVSNPLTMPLQYLASWKLGTLISSHTISWANLQSLLAQLKEAGLQGSLRILSTSSLRMLWPVVAGGVIIATPFSIAAYFLSLRLYISRQRRRLIRKGPYGK